MSSWQGVVTELERLTGSTAYGSLMNQAAILFEEYAGATSHGSLSTRIANAAAVFAASTQVTSLNRAASSIQSNSGVMSVAKAVERLRLALAGSDSFISLIAQADVPGRGGTGDSAVTNTSTGTRKSAMAGGADVAANVADAVEFSGIPLFSSMAGATNLGDPLPSGVNWAKINATAVGELLTEKVGTSLHHILGTSVSASSIHTITVDIKPSGRDWVALQPVNNRFAFIRISDGTIGDENGGYVQSDIGWIDLGDGYYRLSINSLSAVTNPAGAIYLAQDGTTSNYAGDITKGAYLRNIRHVALSAPAAAFSDGTAKGEVYAADVLSFAPVFAAQGTNQMSVETYGYSDDENPVNAEARLFSATGFEVYLDASGFPRTTGGAISTRKLQDGVQSIVTVTWDGVNQTIQVDDETPVSAAAAGVPSGTAYHGNNAAGTRPLHGLVSTAIYEEVLSAAQIAIGDAGFRAAFAGVETQ